jgi:hypothetical protein
MNVMRSSAVFDTATSTIYLIGGFNFDKNMDTADIYTFNLITNQWSFIVPQSEFIPDGIEQHFSYLAPNRVIYTFGVAGKRYYSEILTFNLNNKQWGTTNFQGDSIPGRKFPTATSFTWNNTDYIALYGGYIESGYDSNLYL